MTSRHPQPEGAPIELSEETRLRRAELIMQLVAVFVGILAAVAQALLQSEDLSLAEKAGLRLTKAGLAPIIRRLETLAAEYREGLPEPDGQTTQTEGVTPLDGKSGSLLTPPASRPAAADGRAATGPIPWPGILLRPSPVRARRRSPLQKPPCRTCFGTSFSLRCRNDTR